MPKNEPIIYIGKLEEIEPNQFHLSVPDVPLFHLAGTREKLKRIAEPILAQMLYMNEEAGFPIPKRDYQGESSRRKRIENIPIEVTPRPNATNELIL